MFHSISKLTYINCAIRPSKCTETVGLTILEFTIISCIIFQISDFSVSILQIIGEISFVIVVWSLWWGPELAITSQPRILSRSYMFLATFPYRYTGSMPHPIKQVALVWIPIIKVELYILKSLILCFLFCVFKKFNICKLSFTWFIAKVFYCLLSRRY